MRSFRITQLLLAGVFFLAIAGPRFATAQPGNAPFVPGEVILKFRSNATEPEKEQVRAGLGGPHMRGFGRIRAELRRLGNMTVEEAIALYRNHPKVEYIEPNYIVNAIETPNDPMFSQLYAMRNTGQTGGTAGADIRATNAWDVFTGSSQVLIGVIDTGVDYTHADLAANIWTNPNEIPGNNVDDDNNGFVDDVRGWDFRNDDADPMDDHGHGTHVSGTIGAVGNNAIGVVGVCWNVKIVPLKFLSASGSGSVADAIDAVAYATQLGVRMTSNSWGGGGFSQALLDAITDANVHGVLFVAAAGNNGANTDVSAHYPSSYNVPNVISVAATDHNDQLASFSNYGATTVDLAAPGVNILSTFPGNSYGSISGTSMATPHVAGALGLVFGRFPGIGHLDAKSLIMNFADPKPQLAGKMVTGGRLNAFLPIADPDSIPPDAITDVAATNQGSNWLVFGWTATGDDGPVGDASRYVVKWSTAPINDVNFDVANTVPDPPDPSPAGSTESVRINGLDFLTTYYVAVKALDEFGNASIISNVATGTTLGIPDIQASPLSFTETLLSGATAAHTLTLSNVGQGTLDFQIPTPQLLTGSPAMMEYLEIDKDQPDPRPGILGNGGPDAFGYRWADSDDPGGPAFSWTDISGTGTVANTAGDDSNTGPFPIGFTFPFYGVEYTSFRVCSNGWLSFTSTATSYSNQPLPNTGAPTALVAPFWDDLTLTASGDVYYQSDGNRLIVQWHNVPNYNTGGPHTFQAILHQDGTIEFQYLTMGSGPNSATIGIQNAPRTDGLTVVYNAAYLHDNMAIRIAAVPQWLTASPIEGTIYAPNSADIAVAMNSTGLLGGVYQGNVRITSNDPDESPFEVPVQLTVVGAPDIAVAPASIDYGQVFLGATPVEILEVQNPGTDVLHVSAVSVDNPAYTVNPATFDVPPRSRVNVEVTFSAPAVGSYPATLTVTSDDPDEPTVTVALTGESVPPPDFSVTPAELASNLLTDQTETQQLTLSNTGGANLEWSASLDFTAALQSYTLTVPEVPIGPDEDGGVPPSEFRTTSIQAELADLTGVDILWDRSNGQSTTTSWSTIVADLTARGATVTQSTDPITPALLANYDVLWFSDAGSTATFDANELAALTAWLNGGGGLYLEGDNTSSVNMFNVLLDALGAGIVCSLDDNATGVSTNIHPHETTVGVNGVYLTAAVASIGSVTAPGGRLVDDINGRPNTAFALIGAGRLVVAADEIFQNGHLGQGDNQLFGNQVIDWLAAPAFLRVSPTAGTIAPGGSQVVDALFDATGLYGGLYEASVRITTNDPLAPLVTVPAALQVTGVPNLVLDPTSLDFGIGYIGYPVLREFEIRNSGTDVLTITGITPDHPSYTVFLGGGGFPIQLNPLASTVVQVRFSPSAVGVVNAVLTVDSNDPDTPSAVVNVTGNGLEPPIASVNPTSLQASLATGATETQQFVVSNTGNSDLNWSTRIDFQFALQEYTLTAPERPSGPDEDGAEVPADFRTTPIRANLADLTGVNLLWDRSNGQSTTTSWSTIVADLTARGATVTVSTDPLTSQALANYDVLWFSDAGTSATFDADELAALKSWVMAGGGLLLEGDNTSSVNMFNVLLADLGANIVCSLTDNATGVSTNLYPHPTTEGVAGVYLTGALASLESVAPPGARLVDDINGRPSTAYVQIGAGRVIVTADELFQNGHLGQGNNQLFGNQVIDWLATPVFLSPTPESGATPPGGSTTVDVLFDAGGLVGGNYTSIIRVNSNDPLNGSLSVAATLNVTGVPALSFGSTTLDFGDAFVGYPETMTLTVNNGGTGVLSVSSIASGLPDYTVDPPTFDVGPFQSRDVQVIFTPQATGDRSSILTFTSNDPASPHQVTVIGAGLPAPIASVAPASLHADLLTGDTSTQQVALTNTGGSNLEWMTRFSFQFPVLSVTLTPPDASSEELDGGTKAPDFRTAPIQAELANLAGVDILWDRSNGQSTTTSWTTMVADLTARGATVTVSTEPITPELLSQYEILWCIDTGSSHDFDAAELTALTAWVNGGGAILMEGDNTSSVEMYNALLGALGAGIVCSLDDNATGTTTNIHPHPTTAGVTGIYITAAVASIGSVTAPAGRLVDDINGRPNTAFSEIGAGRVVVAADELFQNSRMGTASNQLFGNQVFDWLATPVFLAVDPSSGVLAPGANTTLNVEFDATGLRGGDYTGAVHVVSNDPANPDLAIAATMHVTGAPRIRFSSTSLDFGNGFIGYPETMTLEVRNVGTEVLSVTSVVAGLADYSVDAASFDLTPNQSRNVVVSFNAQTTGARNSTLTFTSSDPYSPHEVAVTGNGLVAPVITASPSPLEGTALPGGTKVKTLTVCNTGGSDLTWAAGLHLLPASESFTLTAPDASSEEQDGGTKAPDFRTTPIQAQLADLTGVDILWDRSNGQAATTLWTTLIADLTSRGATVTESTAPITTELLAGYEVFWCIDTGSSASFDAGELAALTAWVSGGGGILMEGDNTSSVDMYNDLLAALGAGIVCSLDDNATGTSTNIHPHQTTQGVTGIYITAAVASIGSVVSPGGRLVDDIDGVPNTAFSLVGAGRIIVAADELFQNSRMGTASNQLFGNQVFDWLATPGFISVDPREGVIPAGQCASLTVTLDATDLEAGEYAASIGLQSNDPATPELGVPVFFHVGSIAVADMDVDPDVVRLSGGGAWMTVKVELPAGYTPQEIVLSTVRCNGVAASSQASTIGDFNGNGVPDRQFKFPLSQVVATFGPGSTADVTVLGEIEDRIFFIGTQTIRILHPRIIVPNGGESLTAGGTVDVQWVNPEGMEGALASLWYSADDGVTWTLVADEIAGQSHVWQVPLEPTSTGRLRVYIHHSGQNVLGFDTSDQSFTIGGGVTGIEDPRVPAEYALRMLSANPAPSGQVTLELALPKPSSVSLRVYDVRGGLIKELAAEPRRDAGRHRIDWDGTNRTGTLVGPGVYFVRATAGDRTFWTRLAFLQ